MSHGMEWRAAPRPHKGGANEGASGAGGAHGGAGPRGEARGAGGEELFAGASRSVAVTEAGEALVARARRILAEADAIGEDVDAVRGVLRGRVVIGSMQSLGPFDLPGLLADFHAQHPGIDVVLREDTTQRMVAMLGADELDLAVATIDEPRPNGLEPHGLYTEDLVLVVAPAHPLAG